MKSKKITHRCDILLYHNSSTNNKVAIRYGYKFKTNYHNEKKKWWLDSLQTDNEWDTTYMIPIVHIYFCPFCGKELNDVEETN